MEEDRYTRITLRIPKELHAKLQEASDATSKSMNAEIVARLDASFGFDAKGAESDGLKESTDRVAQSILDRIEEVIRSRRVHFLDEFGVDPSKDIEPVKPRTPEIPGVNVDSRGRIKRPGK